MTTTQLTKLLKGPRMTTSHQMTLTPRQQEIKDRLDAGLGAREIAEELGISRNAVYQGIQRLRRLGAVPQDYTPSGTPARDHASLHNPKLAPAIHELLRVRNELDLIAQRIGLLLPT